MKCFLHRVKRRVRNDSTVMIDKKLYDVPMEFIRSTVEVRYRPEDPDSAFISDSGRRFPICPSDKTANSRIRCNNNNGYSVRYGGAS